MTHKQRSLKYWQSKTHCTGVLLTTLFLSGQLTALAAEETTVVNPTNSNSAATATTTVNPISSSVNDSTTGATADSTTNPTANSTSDSTTNPIPKLLIKPGQSISVGTNTEDLVSTYDLTIAHAQVAAYPDSPEASFILAVALSRTSHVEEALQEIKHARKLAETQGGPAYFDKMIGTYEEMLKNSPKANQVRYELAWAYYMKAYLLAKYSRRPAPQPGQQKPSNPTNPWELAAALGSSNPAQVPHIQGALERANPEQVPQIKKYYEAALQKLDELLAKEPTDIWAKTYRAFLKAEYTGNLPEAMHTWQECQKVAPDNPAPYFFLGEAYLKEGNLKECINNISKAISLRAIGK